MEQQGDKAKGIEVAGVVVAGALSVVPGIGGPAGVVAAYFASLPMQRRTERLLNDIQRDIMALFEKIDAPEYSILESEAFNAALFRTVRASLEAYEGDKQGALRNALLNGYIVGGYSERDRFMALVDGYDPGHLLVLDAVRSLMENRTTTLDHAVSMVTHHLERALEERTVRVCLSDLVNDGMLWENMDREIREEYVGGGNEWTRPQKVPRVHETPYHTITDRGREFLRFVASPTAEATAAEEAPKP